MTTIQDRIKKFNFEYKKKFPNTMMLVVSENEQHHKDIEIEKEVLEFWNNKLIQSIKEVEEETRKETLGEEKLINGKIYKTYLANVWCYNCNKIIQFNVPKGYKVSDALSPLVVNEYKPKCPICDTQSLRKLTEKEKLSITNKEKQ